MKTQTKKRRQHRPYFVNGYTPSGMSHQEFVDTFAELIRSFLVVEGDEAWIASRHGNFQIDEFTRYRSVAP